jgi:hypothetical protein
LIRTGYEVVTFRRNQSFIWSFPLRGDCDLGVADFDSACFSVRIGAPIKRGLRRFFGYCSQLRLWVRIPAPMKRGLRLDEDVLLHVVHVVRIPAPMKRGLRRHVRIAMGHRMVPVRIPAPMKRGLRPVLAMLNNTPVGGVRIPAPMKRGLRQTLDFDEEQGCGCPNTCPDEEGIATNSGSKPVPLWTKSEYLPRLRGDQMTKAPFLHGAFALSAENH